MGKLFRNNIRCREKQGAEGGFLLPGVIMLCLAIAIFSTASLNVITATSTTLSNTHYKTVAENAAKTGIVAATVCVDISSSALWTNDKPLVPSSDCR